MKYKYLEEIGSESGAYANNELQINGDTLYYSEKLEVFIRVDQHHNVNVSKNISNYNHLRSYGNIYGLLVDLDFNSNLINEIFLANNNENEYPLVFVRIFANEVRKETNQSVTKFKSKADMLFLEELKLKPNLASFMTITNKLHKALTEAQGIATVKFVVTDDTTECYYKEICGNPEEKSIKINLLVDYPTKEIKMLEGKEK